MIDSTLVVDLDSATAELGSFFRGLVTRVGEVDDLIPNPKQRARAVRLKLHWFTEGRGETDRATVGELSLPLDRYGRLNTRFRLAIPKDQPISYDGSLIRIRWQLEAIVDLKMRRDNTPTILPVVVIPRGGFGRYERAHPLRSGC